jgi:addiction module RelB/DinJ family antitoxin
MTTLQIRIEEKTKKAAQKVLARHGLDLSSGIRLYLSEIVQKQDVVATLRISSRLERAIEEAERDLKAGKASPVFRSVDEMISHLRHKGQ